jgi:fructosamine-3-kinase
MWEEIAADIARATGQSFTLLERAPVTGGCINEALRLLGSERSVFLKLNDASRRDMFEAEAAGLDALRGAGALRVPEPLAQGVTGGRCWLALEFIDLGGGSRRSQTLLGEGLAALHASTDDAFGWDRDNTIGDTPQVNRRSADWVDFLRVQRLGFQFTLADDRGAGGRLRDLGERLLASLDTFFTDYRPAPSLLHGDLWGGNWGADAEGQPVLFDPAVYYGDREADIAMTELFGGFGADFYTAYDSTWPLDPGYRVRRELYNLYHVLNHFNLFGGGYGRQAEAMASALLAEVG